jgi:subtilisin family serine protease/subtilisin-like proprotein convertase family protein
MPAKLRVEPLEDRSVPAQAFDPGRVLVTFATASPGVSQVAALRESPVSDKTEPLGFGVYRVDLADGTSVATAVHDLSAVAGVRGVQPDYRVAVAVAPNDPRFASQPALSRIGAPAAWGVTTGTGNTVVAVIDTGVDTGHPDLATNLWRNPREAANGLDDDRNGFVDDVFGADFANNDGNPMDDNGHGTHVAGIVGAVGNNSVGVTGVAWTTRIMALKFSAADGGGFTSNAVRALDYAVANGARVVNASWGGTGYDPALLAAIQRARAAGVIVVAAAGNQGADTDATPFYPAGYVAQADNVVAVAAADGADRLASFSNFGRATVALAAPGTSITSTLTGNRYGPMSGTSMAAPMVSGALALLWDAHPTWSYGQVIAKLKQSAAPVAALAGKTQTGGRLDLARLLDAAPTEATGPYVTAVIFTGTQANTFDRARVTFNEAIDPATFSPADVAAVGPTGAVGVSSVTPVAGTGNTQFDVTLVRPQTAAGGYTMTVGPDIRDAAGNAMDQNRNGVGGETSDRFTGLGSLAAPAVPPAPPPSAPGRRSFFAAGLPKAIQDRRTTRVEITVADDVRVKDLLVQVLIDHPRLSDLQLRLVAPDGRIVTLFNRRGGAGANLNYTVFHDQAGAALASGAAPYHGFFRPEQPLASLDGTSARGVWVLQIFDLADGATGTIRGAAFSVVTQPQAASQRVPTTLLNPQAPSSERFVSLSARDLRGTTDALQTAVLSGRADVVTPVPAATPSPKDRRRVELPQGDAIMAVAMAFWPVSVDSVRTPPAAPPPDPLQDHRPVEV